MVNESDIPAFRDAGLNPVGQLHGHRFADRKQSSLLAKIIKTHMPKKSNAKRKPARRNSNRRGRTIEADNKMHVGPRKQVFY